jgi:hypothetical protein
MRGLITISIVTFKNTNFFESLFENHKTQKPTMHKTLENYRLKRKFCKLTMQTLITQICFKFNGKV